MQKGMELFQSGGPIVVGYCFSLLCYCRKKGAKELALLGALTISPPSFQGRAESCNSLRVGKAWRTHEGESFSNLCRQEKFDLIAIIRTWQPVVALCDEACKWVYSIYFS
jgi:hypothetical protein